MPYQFPLAVCAEMLWQDKPIEWRVSKLTEMGFAVGLWNWPAHDLDKLEKTMANFSIMNGYCEDVLLAMREQKNSWLQQKRPLLLGSDSTWID